MPLGSGRGRAAVARPDIQHGVGSEVEFAAVVVGRRLSDRQDLAVGSGVEHEGERVVGELGDHRVACGVGEVQIGQIEFGVEREAEQTLLVAVVGERRACHVGDVKHGRGRLVVARDHGAAVLDDEEAGVARCPGRLDGLVEGRDLDQTYLGRRERAGERGDRGGLDGCGRGREIGVGRRFERRRGRLRRCIDRGGRWAEGRWAEGRWAERGHRRPGCRERCRG